MLEYVDHLHDHFLDATEAGLVLGQRAALHLAVAPVVRQLAARDREQPALLLLGRAAAELVAPLERLRNRTRWQVWLRGTDRTALRRVARTVAATEVSPKVRVQLDVDPMSAL